MPPFRVGRTSKMRRTSPFLNPIGPHWLLSHFSRLTLCDPIDGSPPGSPVPGILQAGTLEWAAIAFSNAWKWKVKVESLSRVQLLATPRTAAYQAPPSMGFSRQECWSGVPLPALPTLAKGCQRWEMHTLNWARAETLRGVFQQHPGGPEEPQGEMHILSLLKSKLLRCSFIIHEKGDSRKCWGKEMALGWLIDYCKAYWGHCLKNVGDS